MVRRKIRRLAVTNGGGEVEGILSVGDVVTFAERGTRGITTPELSFDGTMAPLRRFVRSII